MIIINKLLNLIKFNNVDYLNINKIEERNQVIEKLKDLIPLVFNDNELDLEKLKQVLGLENNLEQNEKYGLNWVGKSKAFYETTKTSTMTLIPQRDRSMNFDESNNIIIEGDNLEVLKLLEKSYFNKIDVIYIDPPYNTGNDFVYNDDFKQNKKEFDLENNLVNDNGNKLQTKNTKSDGRFHTNWLNMMYPRLILARKLLKDEGVFFISIDDNEQARLKVICDEIFGESNFVSDITWIKKHGPGGNTSFNYKIINNKENILCYSKNYEKVKMNYIIHDEKNLKKLGYVNKDEYFDERGYYKLTHLYRPSSTGSFQYTESLDYPITAPDGTLFKLHVNKNGEKRGSYTWGYETYLEGNKLGFIECKKNNGGDWVAYRKQYQYVKFDPKTRKIIKTDAGQQYENIIDDFYSSMGGSEIIKIFDNKNIFDFPKPMLLIKYLLKMATKNDSVVLDFFAGSGTTGQAIMELNKEDDGKRQFILVQYPEESDNLKGTEFATIADITCERIKRSIEMYNYKEKGFKVFKLVDTNLKSFEANTDDSNESIQSKLFDIENKIKPYTNVEDLIYEIMLRIGKLPLNTKIKSEIIANNKIYYDENKHYLFILEPTQNYQYYKINLDIVKHIYQNNDLMIFLNDQYFENDQDKINFAEEVKNLSQEKIKLVVI